MILELDTTKRRHSMYYSNYAHLGWVDTPDSSLRTNYLKATTAGLIGCTM